MNKTSILFIVIAILALVVVYLLVVSPMISNNNMKQQQLGVQLTINAIVSSINQNGYVQIPVGNQTLVLIPYTPPKTNTTTTTGK